MPTPPSLMDVARGAQSALGPARLIWGLLLVLVISAFASLFDAAHLAAGGARIGPGGLIAGAWPEEVAQAAERSAAGAASQFVAGTTIAGEAGAEQPLAEWRGWIDRAHLERRGELAAAESPDPGRAALLDSRYREVRAALEAARPRGPFEAFAADELAALRRLVGAALSLAPAAVIEALVDFTVRNPMALVSVAPWLALLGGLPLLIVIAVLGGGLARLAALEATRGVKGSAFDAATWVRSNVLRLILVPILPVFLLTLLFLAIILFGVLLRVPFLNVIGGALYGLVLLVAFLIVTGGVAAVITFPMAVGSVAAGDADAADAFVRPVAYLFRHPVRTLGTLLVGAAAVILGAIIVGAVISAIFAVTAWGTGIFGGSIAGAVGRGGLLEPAVAAPPIAGVTGRFAGSLIDLWDGLLLALLAAYVASAVADVALRTYLALRYRCDGQDVSTLDGETLGAD